MTPVVVSVDIVSDMLKVKAALYITVSDGKGCEKNCIKNVDVDALINNRDIDIWHSRIAIRTGDEVIFSQENTRVAENDIM